MDRAEFQSEYRKGRRDFRDVDLGGADLTTLYPDNVDLTGASLGDADLSNSQWMACKFDNVDLLDAKMEHCYMRSCSFTDADFAPRTTEGAQFVGCMFDRVDVSRLAFVDTEWRGGYWTYGNLASCSFTNCKFKYVIMHKADLRDTHWNGGWILGSDIAYCDFSGAGGLTTVEMQDNVDIETTYPAYWADPEHAALIDQGVYDTDEE